MTLRLMAPLQGNALQWNGLYNLEHLVLLSATMGFLWLGVGDLGSVDSRDAVADAVLSFSGQKHNSYRLMRQKCKHHQEHPSAGLNAMIGPSTSLQTSPHLCVQDLCLTLSPPP